MTKLKEVFEDIEYAKEKIGLFTCLSIFIIVSFYVFGYYGMRYVGRRIITRIDTLSNAVEVYNKEANIQDKTQSKKLYEIDLRLSKLEVEIAHIKKFNRKK